MPASTFDSPHPTPTLLLTSLPPSTLLGINLTTFNSTPTFHGIRNIQSGPTFLYTGATSAFSIRHGAWFFVGNRKSSGWEEVEVRVWKWNAKEEELVQLQRSDEDAVRMRANMGAIWRAGGLWGYEDVSAASASAAAAAKQSREAGGDEELDDEDDEEDAEGDWHRLTDCITERLVSRICGGDESHGAPGEHSRYTLTSASSAEQDKDHIPGLTATEANLPSEKNLTFIPINLKQTWRKGAVGRERTEAAQDRSWALVNIISNLGGNSDGEGEKTILGELQFTFLMVLTLSNYSCLEQWKRLLELILTCQTEVVHRASLFTRVLRLIKLQLRHCDDVEGGLFEMSLDEGAVFLQKFLRRFGKALDDVSSSVATEGDLAEVKDAFGDLERWCKASYGWSIRDETILKRGILELEDGEMVQMDMNDADEDEETGEYAPVVVDLGEYS